jgi:hypothetical protein
MVVQPNDSRFTFWDLPDFYGRNTTVEVSVHMILLSDFHDRSITIEVSVSYGITDKENPRAAHVSCEVRHPIAVLTTSSLDSHTITLAQLLRNWTKNTVDFSTRKTIPLCKPKK